MIPPTDRKKVKPRLVVELESAAFCTLFLPPLPCFISNAKIFTLILLPRAGQKPPQFSLLQVGLAAD